MKQNVSAPAALIILVVALVAAFLMFNRQTPEPVQYEVAVPETPPIQEGQVTQMRQGLSPLGIIAVLPPLMEDRQKGVRVAFVLNRTPAQAAGLQPGDFISSFNGMKLMSPDGLVASLYTVDPAKSYVVDIVRSGKPMKLTVTGISPLPPEQQVRH